MNTLVKFVIAAACAVSLMYFDSLDNKPKEKANVGNNHLGSRNGDFRIRIGNLRLHRVCFVSNKQASRRVKCPVCEWTRTPDNRYMCNKIERVIIATQIKKRKNYGMERTDHKVR